MPPMKRLAATIPALGLVFLASACGSSNDDTGPTTIPSVTTTVPVTTTATAPAGAQTDVSVPATTAMSHLTSVQVTPQGSGDRVVFGFDAGVPGYATTYTTSPVASGGDSGAVAVKGNAVLKTTFASAAGVDLTGGIKRYYTGPTRFTPPGANIITEVTQVSDGEGQLVWAIGVPAKTNYAVSTSTGPAQVIIDFTK